MDQQTNEQDSRSTEGGQVKVGDRVWVLCKVIDPCENLIKVTGSGNDNWFWAGRGQCRPVEPSSCPEIPDSSSDPINPSQYKQFVIVNDNDGNQTLYVDGVLMEGDNTVYGCDIDQAAKGCTIKIESRDVDFIVEHWPLRLSDLSIEKQPETNPLTPSPCMDGVNADEFTEGIMETRGRASDPINPIHYKQGGIECIEAIGAALGDGFPDYLRGNVIKYLWRYKEKGGVDDLRKSAWYLDRLISEVGE